MSYWITSTNPDRLEGWDRVMQMDVIPVTTARPMMVGQAGHRRPKFMIDAARLSGLQRLRLIGWVWKMQRFDVETAVAMVEAGVLIDGHDCEVVEPMDECPSASLFAYGCG